MEKVPTPPSKTISLQILCQEPFRVFFPLGIFCGLIGVSHWVWYYTGLSETYSCNYHALLQIQGFQISFVVGFLMTALPKFMEVPGARPWELLLGVVLLAFGVSELYVGDWVLSEVGFLALIVHTALFALRRFPKRRDTPPPEFVFVLFGFLHALAGGLLILWPMEGFVKLGQRVVEQGMPLAFIMGIGSYLGPRLLGRAQTPGTSVEQQIRLRARQSDKKKVFLYALTGLGLMLSFWVEAGFSTWLGKGMRALAVSSHLVKAVGITRTPGQRLWHLRFLWISFWCVIGGLWLAALFPEYEIPALHVTFIGGFGLMTLTVATRVIVAHCGFEALWERDSKAILVFGFSFLLALLSRVAADLFPDYYFGILYVGAGFWLTSALTWGLVFLPKVAPWHVTQDD